VLGVFGVALFCTFQNLGLYFADATTTSLLNGVMPVLIAALAVPILRERLSPMQLAGAGMSIAGVLMIALEGAGSAPRASLGNLLPLGSVLALSIYAVLSRSSFGSCNALAVITGATRYGFLMLLPGVATELVVQGPPHMTP
jgi:drug/metabolite transporter (DMT)-like permease